jgi:hypothetical protein
MILQQMKYFITLLFLTQAFFSISQVKVTFYKQHIFLDINTFDPNALTIDTTLFSNADNNCPKGKVQLKVNFKNGNVSFSRKSDDGKCNIGWFKTSGEIEVTRSLNDAYIYIFVNQLLLIYNLTESIIYSSDGSRITGKFAGEGVSIKIKGSVEDFLKVKK